MKIQPIEFPLGIGTADELRIIVDKGVAYYNLVDTTKTTGIEFAFKVLHSSSLKLEEGQEDADSLIINMLGVNVIE